MEQFKVKRTISRQRWFRIRLLFAKTVELGRKAILEKKDSPHRQAAQDILFEALAPLNKKERRIVINALTESAMDTNEWFGGNNFSHQADEN